MTVGLRFLPQAFFKIKNEERKSFADWLIELTNCGFGMSTDAIIVKVPRQGSENYTIFKQPLVFPTIPQSFVMSHFTMLGFIFGIDCQTTMKVQEKLINSLPVEIYV